VQPIFFFWENIPAHTTGETAERTRTDIFSPGRRLSAYLQTESGHKRTVGGDRADQRSPVRIAKYKVAFPFRESVIVIELKFAKTSGRF